MMKLLPLAAAAASLAVAFAAHAAGDDDRGPGLPGQRQGDAMVYSAQGFDTVGLGGAAHVEVRVGGNYSVRAVGPAAAFENFRVEVRDGALNVGPRYRSRHGDDDLQKRITVYVTLPHLKGANVGGSGSLHADRVEGAEFSGAVGGSGSLRVDALRADKVNASIGGSGDIRAAGMAKALNVNIGGSGSFTGPDMHAASAKVSSAGSGRVRAVVDGPAKVSLVGSGEIDLGSAARCSVTKMGSGSVRCGA
jgi:hypothetical protein